MPEESSPKRSPQNIPYKDLPHIINADGQHLFCRYWKPATAARWALSSKCPFWLSVNKPLFMWLLFLAWLACQGCVHRALQSRWEEMPLIWESSYCDECIPQTFTPSSLPYRCELELLEHSWLGWQLQYATGWHTQVAGAYQQWTSVSKLIAQAIREGWDDGLLMSTLLNFLTDNK